MHIQSLGIGSRYGNLVVIKDLGMSAKTCKRASHYFECKCDCGRTTQVVMASLKSGNTKTCGRCNNSGAHHGYGCKIYNCYLDMRARCYDPKLRNYNHYGGRGISVCEEWMDHMNGFENFVKWSMANGFNETLSIDRIDNDGGYNPHNCRWTTRRIQNINKRPSTQNTSGYVGIRKHNITGWYGSVKVDNKDHYTGWSKDIMEAVKMRNDYIIRNNLDNKLNEVR